MKTLKICPVHGTTHVCPVSFSRPSRDRACTCKVTSHHRLFDLGPRPLTPSTGLMGARTQIKSSAKHLAVVT